MSNVGKVENVVTGTLAYPDSLKTAEEVSISIKNWISADRILELAESGYMPHYRIVGESPRFKVTEVKNWLANNLVSECRGRNLPEVIRVVIPPPDLTDRPPTSISNVSNLTQLPKHGYQPGVYFLCKEGEVIYVGQSISPSSRIATHVSERQKDFDRVYLLPTPMSELDQVEASFIHHLRPSQQGGIRAGRKNPISPVLYRPKEVTLRELGVTC